MTADLFIPVPVKILHNYSNTICNRPIHSQHEQRFIQSIFPRYAGGDVKRAPDGKIYFSIAYVNAGVSYPYPDSVYNNYNMNLSLINSPDSFGTACDFQPYSFYLGGKRTYYGLPNNPDYFLGPKIGSPCDTITAISEASQQTLISNIYQTPEQVQ